MNKKYLETYSNFLIASTKSAHSTDLQKITDSEFSKDSVYRFLSSGQFCEKNYWLSIRKTLRSVEDSNACISFDDTIVHKPHSQTNEVIEYYWDHTNNCLLIASGIIMDKEDVILALKAGAISISTTKSNIWSL